MIRRTSVRDRSWAPWLPGCSTVALPGEHIWIEQVPGIAGSDPRAGLWTRLDESLRGEHLHRFPDDRAARAQLALGGQQRAGLQIAAENAAADRVDDPSMQALLGIL